MKLEGSFFKQEDKAGFTPENVINIFILYDINSWSQDLTTDFNLGGCLLGCVELTKNADPDKYHIVVMVLDSIRSLPGGSVG